MLRIAFDVSSTRGEKTGIGRYTADLIRALRQYENEIEVIELDDGATANQRTDRRIAREQFVLPKLAQHAHADILHLTGFAAPIRTTLPVVMTAMDLIGVLFAQNYPPTSRLYWSRYLPFTLRFPTWLITLSEHTKRDLVRLAHIPPERVSVIPPGRDEMFRPIENRGELEQARRELGLPDQFFLFVGTLEPRKGIDTLLDAFTKVAAELRDDLVLVGKRGWAAEEILAQVARLGLETRVRFLDYVTDEKLPYVYNLARALVFPSRYEGFGLPVLEAMSCGTPVICSNVSSLPEVAGAAAILIPRGDAEGFAGAMALIARDENRRAELGARGMDQSKKFSWARAARETIAVYERLISHQ